MGRAATKQDLISSAKEKFDKMWKLVDSMTEEEQRAAFCFEKSNKMKEAHWTRDNNLRDIFIHLYEWHQLLLNWVEANQNGRIKPFLPAPYNWKNYGQMNAAFWKKHQSTTYEEAKKLLLDSHGKVMDMIGEYSNEELFEKKHFSWTGTTNMGSYCISATSSHYEWAAKKIKMQIKALREGESE